MLPAGNVEVWLAEVERRMKGSVRTQVSNHVFISLAPASGANDGQNILPAAATLHCSWGRLRPHIMVDVTCLGDSALGLLKTACPLFSVQIIAAMHAYPSRPRTAWVQEWPAMVVLAVSQIFWARGVEEALTQGTVQVGAPGCIKQYFVASAAVGLHCTWVTTLLNVCRNFWTAATTTSWVSQTWYKAS
jgi:hypothetical protein